MASVKRLIACFLMLFLTSAVSAQDIVAAVPRKVKAAQKAVVAVRLAKKTVNPNETFRQRWHRQRKEKYGAMNQKGDGDFGAGFFIDGDGHILTSLGFVKKDRTLEVLLPNGRLLKAKLVAQDKRNDFAILKVAKGKKPYPFLKLSATKSEASDIVFTLGNSFKSVEIDLQVAVSRGEVTSVFPVIKGKGRYRGTAIETNASINPGDYGGPLLNRKGEVVGLVTAGFVLGRRAGLAVPANQIKKILPTTLKGKKTKPYFGIEVKVRAADGVGVPIIGVRDKFPASDAGLQAGEVILAVNGVKTNNAAELKKAILMFPAHSDVELSVKSADGKTRRINLEPKAVAVSGVRGM